MLTNTTAAPRCDEAAFDQLRADARAGLVEIVADRHADRHHAPVERQPPRGVLTFGGGDDRRPRPQRGEAARSGAAARDRDDRLRGSVIGQRDRRFAQRLGVIVVAPIGGARSAIRAAAPSPRRG